ncbi:hypothetical protein BO83DRAFT_435393 [Aspergillus eucalypticola CBS 122712]|uniref:Uncharacterized protein n=1 Tax=Aspergillus eucalypticola (strain CBS 122712 / IBT 29274) TaxID=1448314 RepID=A0A317W0U1_ASPEC|nr:uncharacterized protein BO83DRAFT_435393 [Aspergillus eucalypticola CBS 122712]PWY78768.1 hypothetical protein BO83DRAFT_435393 [Aspergillus eucalypticola CBS 122712]
MPPHVLLSANMQIVGVTDWEFSYAAPAEFSAASQSGYFSNNQSIGQMEIERFFGPAESPEVSWKMTVKLVYEKQKK